MALMKLFADDFDWPGRLTRQLLDDEPLRVEEFEDDGELVVRAEMPGIDPAEDVEITVTDHRLHLRAERRSEETTEDKTGYRSEFRYGSFSRTVRLPVNATADDVKATYLDGILEVRFPVTATEEEARRIPVSRG